MIVYISRYFAAKGLPIADQYYPSCPRTRAKVDEYLEWQANNLRLGGAMYFKTHWIQPRIAKKQSAEPVFDPYTSHMESSLDCIENTWLADTTFLTSNSISIADILACCDIEQIRITSYNPFEGRPKLENLWRSVRELTSPFYDDAHAVCYKMAKSQLRNSN